MNPALIPRVAHFCMEYGIAEDLPIYAGGLGILGGDLLKAAGDLRLPVTGVGIFWSEGYTEQRVGADGQLHDSFPPTPRAGLTPTDVQVTVRVRGRDVPVTAWRVDRPGLATLYLLEPALEADRWLTRRLYGGGAADRVAQEIILGVGGVRVLRALGVDVDVYHLNDGHAVFAALELIRERMAAGAPFERACRAARAEVAFTTHSPVASASEAHALDLLFEQGADLGLARAARPSAASRSA
jgi:starch phosphorylase